jgi:hypothetical protein
MFGSERALTYVNCEEYTQGHELAKLLGAPPGYVGHNIEPLLSQRRIDEHHYAAHAENRGMAGGGGFDATFPARKRECLSVVLFDEISLSLPRSRPTSGPFTISRLAEVTLDYVVGGSIPADNLTVSGQISR